MRKKKYCAYCGSLLKHDINTDETSRLVCKTSRLVCLRPKREIQFDDDALALMGLFRYALGRSTYMVSVAVKSIRMNWEVLTIPEKIRFKKEIKEQDEFYGSLGMDCDRADWYSIVNKEN